MTHGPSPRGFLEVSRRGVALTRRWAFVTIGLAAGFSGLAVITTILTGLPLLLVEAAMVLIPLTFVIVVVRRTPRPIVLEVWRVVRVGLLAGFAASVVYDAARTVLSILDPSPYNPFEAIRLFGLGMVGADAAPALVFGAGFVIHFLNGTTFGVIYAIFAGRHVRTLRVALVGGMAWGCRRTATLTAKRPATLSPSSDCRIAAPRVR